jgi:hypothetical protein
VCCKGATLEPTGLVLALVLVQGRLALEVLVAQLAMGHDILKFVGQNGKPITLLKQNKNRNDNDNGIIDRFSLG